MHSLLQPCPNLELQNGVTSHALHSFCRKLWLHRFTTLLTFLAVPVRADPLLAEVQVAPGVCRRPSVMSSRTAKPGKAFGAVVPQAVLGGHGGMERLLFFGYVVVVDVFFFHHVFDDFSYLRLRGLRFVAARTRLRSNLLVTFFFGFFFSFRFFFVIIQVFFFILGIIIIVEASSCVVESAGVVPPCGVVAITTAVILIVIVALVWVHIVGHLGLQFTESSLSYMLAWECSRMF